MTLALGLQSVGRVPPPWLLFGFNARDRTMRDRVTGAALTCTRASAGESIDAGSKLHFPIDNMPRYDYTSTGELALRSESAEIANLLAAPEDFSSGSWSKTNVTVTTNAVLSPRGTLTADKVAATVSAATALTQTSVIAGTRATLRVWARRGSGDTDANTFALYNNTTTTDIGSATLNYATGVITTLIGTAYASRFTWADGTIWYLVTVTSLAITSGNTVTGYVGYAGGTETATEYAYFWGAKLGPGVVGGSYNGTSARAADVITAPALWTPDDCSMYVRWKRPFWADSALDLVDARVLLSLGNNGASNHLQISQYPVAGARYIYGAGQPASGGNFSTALYAYPATAICEAVIQCRNMRSAPEMRMDGGAGFGAWGGAAGVISFGSQFSGSILRIGGYAPANGNESEVGVIACGVGLGSTRTLTDMARAVA